MATAPRRRVAVVAGARTPFVKAGRELADLGPLALGAHAVRGLIERHELDPGRLDALAFGVVVADPGRPNLAREIVFEADLPRSIEAQTVSSYCITGLRTVTLIADAIAAGRIEAGLAGGVESLSHSDPATFKEPSTGLAMGEHMEITRRAWNVSRERQDEVALASHRNAAAARIRLAAEMVPLAGVDQDSGPRADTSLAALAALAPAFAEDGTLTAGNSSPVTDGAAVVCLMSEACAVREDREPLAFLSATEYAAIDPDEGLLMAPALAVPRLFERTATRLENIDLVEMHEAFAAQMLANVAALESGWKGAPTGPLDWSRVNVCGGSIALGHPWSATGGRLVTTLANEMARRGARRGLISACAAGAMGGALLLERD